jgi:hypothetical protein
MIRWVEADSRPAGRMKSGCTVVTVPVVSGIATAATAPAHMSRFGHCRVEVPWARECKTWGQNLTAR